MIDWDELKERWAEHDRKIETSLRLNLRILNALQIGRARSALQRLAMFLAVEAAINLAAIVALGSFIYRHIAVARFAVPAVFLDAFAIVILIALMRQMVAALAIDYD